MLYARHWYIQLKRRGTHCAGEFGKEEIPREEEEKGGNKGILEKGESRVSNSRTTYDAFNYVSTESHVTRDMKMYSNRVRPGLARYSSLQLDVPTDELSPVRLPLALDIT